MKNQNLVILLCLSMVLSGCTAVNDEVKDEVFDNLGCTDSNALNFDENATIDDESCVYDEPVELLEIAHIDGCDNTNSIHCMLPFPSDAFLIDDQNTATGKRIHYSSSTIPNSGTVDLVEIPILNQMDGASPNTQIMTAFEKEPDVSELAGQYSISKSLESGHPTVLINRLTGELVPHWVELDVRSEADQPTILHIRTIKALEHNTPYVVAISGLTDESGELVPTPEGFAALRDQVITTSMDIENRRSEFQNLFSFIENVQKFKKIRAIGSASLMLAYVAEGVFDVYYEKDIYIWDVASGLSLVKEAGGMIFFKKTNEFKYEVLASNKLIFDEAKHLLIK